MSPQAGPTAAPAGYQNLDPALASRVLGMVNASNGALPGVRSGFAPTASRPNSTVAISPARRASQSAGPFAA